MSKTFNRLPIDRAVKISKLPIFEHIRNRAKYKNEKSYLEHMLSSESIKFYTDVKALFKEGKASVLNGAYCAESAHEVNNLMLGYTNLLKELRVYSKQSFGSLDSILLSAKTQGGFGKVFEANPTIENATQIIMELISVSYELYKIQMTATVCLGCIFRSTYINNQKLILDTIGYQKYIEIISLSYSLRQNYSDANDDFLRQVLKEHSTRSHGEYRFKEINTSIKEKVISSVSSDSMEFIMGQLDSTIQDSSHRNVLLTRDQLTDSNNTDYVAYNLFTTLLDLKTFTVLSMAGFIYGIDTLSGWTYYFYEGSDFNMADTKSQQLLKMDKFLLQDQFSDIAAAFKSITYSTFNELYISDNLDNHNLSVMNKTKH